MKVGKMKGKKVIAMLLAALVVMPSFNALKPITANAEELFSRTLGETFEGEDLTYKVEGSGKDYASVIDYTGDASLIYGKALKFDISSAPVGEYNYDIRVNNYISSDYTNKANFYAETSFDIVPMLNGRPLYVYLRNNDAGKNFVTLHWSTDGKFYTNTSSGLKKIGNFTNGKLMNVKVVQQWTDADKAVVNKVTGIYINGTPVSTTEVSFPNAFDNQPGKANVIRLQYTQKTANQANAAIIDNVNYVCYTSEDGTSPVADFSGLKSEIATSSALLNSTAYNTNDLSVFKNKILDAVAVYHNIKAPQSDVNMALNTLVDARTDLRLVNQNKKINEDFEDETYTNATLSGNYGIDNEVFGNKFYNKVLKYTRMESDAPFLIKHDKNYAANAWDNNTYAVTSFDFMPYGLSNADSTVEIKLGSEGAIDGYNVVFNVTKTGDLNFSTVHNKATKIYYSGNPSNPLTSPIKVAENIDLNRMHNIKVVIFRNPSTTFNGVESSRSEIVGIYLDGQKLDFLDNSEQTLYPICSPTTRTNAIRITAGSSTVEDAFGTYGVYLDNITGIQTLNYRAVEKELLKDAITESYYQYDNLNDAQKSAVDEKRAEALLLLDSTTAGQSECDAMAVTLKGMLLPELTTFFNKINIPTTIKTSKISLPDLSSDGVSITVNSSNTEVITNDGAVIQPISNSEIVTLDITLTRGEETESKTYTVTVLPKRAVEIYSVKYKDADDNIVYSPVNNGSIVSIGLKNNTDDELNVIVATYFNEQLLNCKILDEVADGSNDVNLPLGANGAQVTVKFFVWYDMTNIEPVQDAVDTSSDFQLHILGDSIFAEQPTSAIPNGQMGVGKALKYNYNIEQMPINNYAYCGQSSKSFANGYRLDSALKNMNAGDFAIVSFAHNDEKDSITSNYAPLDEGTTAPFAEGTFQAYIERYVTELRANGVEPILVTAAPRFVFDDGVLVNTHGGYIQAMIDVANAYDVVVIDMNGYATTQIGLMGEENAERYYMVSTGNGDTTHLTEEGAQWLADYITSQIAALKLPIAKYNAIAE